MVRCLTLAFVSQSWLLPDDRPESVATVEHDSSELRCHVQRESQLDRCEAAMDVVAEMWAIQVDEWGWTAPFPDEGIGGSDGFDIYISTDAEGGAYVLGPYIDADPSDDQMGSTSYMVLDPSIPDEELALYVAHEFNHALQFATDFTEPTYVAWEAAATWVEHELYPEESELSYGVPDFQAAPWAGLFSDSTVLWDRWELWSYYEYGAVLWLHHLEGVYGVTPFELWQSMISQGWDNEPDALDAYDAHTGSWEEALLSLSVDRALVGTDAQPEWAERHGYGPGTRLRPENTLSALDAHMSPEHPTYDLGVAYFTVESEVPVAFHFNGAAEARWRVVLPAQDKVAASGEVIVLNEAQVVGVVNLGPEGFDGDDTPRPRSLEVWITELERDSGDPVAQNDSGLGPGEKRGCGCASRAPARGGGLWVLGGLVGLLALRRRR